MLKAEITCYNTTPPTDVVLDTTDGRCRATWGEDSLTVRSLGAGLFELEHWTEEPGGPVQAQNVLLSLYYSEDTTPLWRFLPAVDPLVAEIVGEAMDSLLWQEHCAGENFPHWLRSMVQLAEAQGTSPTPMLAALQPQAGWRFESHTVRGAMPAGCACVITTPRGYYYTTERVRCP